MGLEFDSSFVLGFQHNDLLSTPFLAELSFFMNADQVDKWCRSSLESENLEFKEAKNQIDSSRLCEYCVAIGNEGGGHLVLGVTDRIPRVVVGTCALPKAEKAVEQVLSRVGCRVDIEEVSHPNGRVVVISIPSRPRGTAFNLEGRYLMRSGERLVAMSEDRLRAIFDEGKPDWLEEFTRTEMTGQDVVESLDIQMFFELMNQPFPTQTSAVLEKLVAERLIQKQGSTYNLHRLGGLLLARRLSEFPDLGRKAPRVVVYKGSSKLETRLDQVGGMGYAVGFRRLVHFIASQLPQNEVFTDAIREELSMIPSIIIRELIANALVHQDFAVTGASVMIEVYEDRVEFSNPGTPVVAVDRFIDAYRSRNERLADLMRRMGICEEKGSGIDKVVSNVEISQLPAPDFQAGVDRTAAIVFGPKPFEEMDREERIRATYQHAVLRHVMRNFMTNQSLRERFRLSDSKSATISQVIAATLEAGLIRIDESVGTSLRLRRYLPYWA